MPLSEHEQRQLEQIEQALYRADRRLARLVRSSDPRVHYRRRVMQALVGLALGAGLVAAGLVAGGGVLSLVGLTGGCVVLLLAGIWALSSWRQMSTVALGGPRRAPDGQRRRRRAKRGRTGRGSSMMERLDERWRKRQEGGL